jgi:TnpA family transposase
MINILTDYEKKQLIQIDSVEKDELIKFYTLNKADIVVIVNKYENDFSRLGVAIQLCVLRHKGWSLTYMKSISDEIVKYLAEQLNVRSFNLSLYLDKQNKKTFSKHFTAILDLYNFNKFDEVCLDSNKVLFEILEESDSSYFLVCKYIEFLKNSKVILPAIYKIEEIVGNAKTEFENKIINSIFTQINKEQQSSINTLLDIDNKTRKTTLAWLRKDNGTSSIKQFNDTTKKLDLLDQINLNIKIDMIPAYKINRYLRLGKKYDPFSFRRFEIGKRISILAIFLQDLHRTLIDKLIIIHDLRMNSVLKKINKLKENQTKEYQELIKNSVKDYVKLGDSILIAKTTNESIDKAIESEFSWEQLKVSILLAKKIMNKNKFNTLDLMDSKYYGELRKYTPTLLKKISIEPVSEKSKDVVNAVNVIKELNSTKKKFLPEEVEADFTNKNWSSNIEKEDGYKKRHFYELAVLNELKNNIRSGDIAVNGSKNFKNFDTYLVSKENWNHERYSTKLFANSSFDEYISSKKKSLNELFEWFSKNKNAIDKALIEDDKIKLKKLGSNYQEEADKLSKELYKMLPKVGLQDILFEVAQMTSFHKELVHASTQKAPETVEDLTVLIYALMGHGTNIGLSKISQSLSDISYKQLSHESDWRLYEENLQKVQILLTNYQQSEPFSDFWGDGTTSSSDGMMVKSKVNALNAGYHPKLGFEKGFFIYRFVNDKYSAFFVTPSSSPNNRDALHVIDGLLKNPKIEEHYTDTSGYTDQVFALASLMGYKFAPRLRNLPDLKLFAIEKDNLYDISKLVRGKTNTKLIENNYDDILRLAHSIREEKVTSSLILSKLGSYSRQNSLSNALKEMGKIERTMFILNFASDPDFRRKIQVGLNKGEELNGLARAVFFGRRGYFWERELQGQLQKASCLNVILNAIVIWNTKYLTKAWNVYKSQNPYIDEKLLQYISPLNWEHINFLGKYLLEMDIEFEDDNLRRLNIL